MVFMISALLCDGTGCLPYDREKSKERKPAAFRCIWDGNVEYLLRFYDLMRFMNGFALDLLQRIFVPQRQRITVSDIVGHPFLVCTLFNQLNVQDMTECQ